jgi:hypothetical protein
VNKNIGKTMRYLAILLLITSPNLLALMTQELKAFSGIVDVARSEQSKFCGKGLSFIIKTIRSDSGVLCKGGPFAASLSMLACNNFQGFLDSKCATNAKNVLLAGQKMPDPKDIAAINALALKRASAILNETPVSLAGRQKVFDSLCRIVTDIMPKKTDACKQVLSKLNN